MIWPCQHVLCRWKCLLILRSIRTLWMTMQRGLCKHSTRELQDVGTVAITCKQAGHCSSNRHLGTTVSNSARTGCLLPLAAAYNIVEGSTATCTTCMHQLKACSHIRKCTCSSQCRHRNGHINPPLLLGLGFAASARHYTANLCAHG